MDIDHFLLDFFRKYGYYANLYNNYLSLQPQSDTVMIPNCTFVQDNMEKVIFTSEVRLRSMHYITDNTSCVKFLNSKCTLKVIYDKESLYIDTSYIPGPDMINISQLSPFIFEMIDVLCKIYPKKHVYTISTILTNTGVNYDKEIFKMIQKEMFGSKQPFNIFCINIFILAYEAVFGINTDRDSYEYKEWITPGKILAINKPSDIINLLRVGSIKIRGIEHKGISSVISARNHLDRLSSIRKIIIPTNENSSDMKIRNIHPSQKGYICYSEISEGKSAGLTKTMAVTCIVSDFIDIEPLKDYIASCKTKKEIGIPLILDGLFIGFYTIDRWYIKEKWEHIGIYFDKIWHVRTVDGRPLRPMKHKYGIHLVDPGEAIFMKDIYEEISDTYIFGLSSGIIPFSNHNQSARIVFASGMQKHMLSHIPPNNYREEYQQSEQVEEPIVTTIMYRTMKAFREESGYHLGNYGRNCLVALTTYEGANQEDAVVINKTSVKNGLFRSYKYKKIRLAEDSIIYNGFEILGNTEFTTKKISIDNIEEVEKYKYMNMEVEYRELQVGDKIASRHAQKSIVGFIVDEDELPYTIIDGKKYIPDILVNPHAIPSRMTVGQLMESVLGMDGMMNKKCHDGTAFRKHDLRPYLDKDIGYVKMFNGKTNQEIQNPISMGYVYYAALRQQVVDKYFSRYEGPVSNLSKQPTIGRSQGGGLRVGEMEVDALIAHDASIIINNLVDQSDSVTIKICKTCKKRLYNNLCEEGHKIISQKIPASLSVSEIVLGSIGIGIRRL